MSTATWQDSSADTLEQYLAALDEPAWLQEVRRTALERYRTMGWPSAQDEEFRRSDLSSYTFDSWSFESPDSVSAEVENPAGLSGTLYFSGARAVRRSLAEGLKEKGVHILSFRDIAAGAADSAGEAIVSAVRTALLNGVAHADNRITVWHYVTLTHGAVVYVPEFVELEEPFLVSFHEDGADVLRAPQVVAAGAAGARFSVVQRVTGEADGEVLYNEAVDVVVGDGGQVNYFILQNVNIDSSFFSNGLGTVGRDATLKMYTAAFGGMFSKYRFDARMSGDGGDAFLGGVYFPHEDQHIDMRTVQHHVAPRAHSLTLYKGAVICEAHSVYQGLISVDHDALNTDAYLTNNNLVLGDEAQADSIPTLQINTDEVRCSHGSTTGKLDDRHLFYLESRGYAPEEARHLLIQGYFEEVLAAYPEIVQEEIHDIVEGRICECD